VNDRFTIALNLNSLAPSQYLEMQFDSVVEFNDKLVCFGPTGVFEEGGQTDDGAAILAWIDTPLHDFGDYRQKRIEAYDIGYESAGSITVTLYSDEDTAHAREFTLSPVKSGQAQQGVTKTLAKSAYGKGRYHKVRVANVAGCDFSLDYLALAPVFLQRRSR
jgi:hypothetical protein